MSEGGPPHADVLLASAARFLIDGGEEDAASILLSCSLTFEFQRQGWREPGGEVWVHTYDAVLAGPRAAYNALSTENHPIRVAIESALRAVFPDKGEASLAGISAKAELLPIDPDW